MREIFRLLGAVVVAGGLLSALGGLEAAKAQSSPKQIRLSEKQVQGFIAAQKKMAASTDDKEFDAVAREYGFSGLEEHDDVEANIILLMGGIDPKSRAFTEPPSQIVRRIEETKADTSLPDEERTRALEELNEALKSAKPIEFPANVELVRKYYDKIKAVLE